MTDNESIMTEDQAALERVAHLFQRAAVIATEKLTGGAVITFESTLLAQPRLPPTKTLFRARLPVRFADGSEDALLVRLDNDYLSQWDGFPPEWHAGWIALDLVAYVQDMIQKQGSE